MALLLCAACSFEHGIVQDASSADSASHDLDAAASDAMPDAPVDARVCPDMPGCTTFRCASTSSCYYYCFATKHSWQRAQEECEELPGGCLVTINDQAEEDCIVANVMPMFVNFPWIGYRQPQNGSEPDGSWSFVCGTSTYAPPWAPNEPNEAQGGAEDCAGMAEDGWFDNGCDDSGRYVCELP